MADLDGRDFRAVTRLSTKANETLAYAGETCDRVPTVSLSRLLASQRIVPVSVITEAEWRDLGRPEGTAAWQ